MIKELQNLLKECNKEVEKLVENKQTQSQTEKNINRLFNKYWLLRAKQGKIDKELCKDCGEIIDNNKNCISCKHKRCEKCCKNR